jgi:hypothetical protein
MMWCYWACTLALRAWQTKRKTCRRSASRTTAQDMGRVRYAARLCAPLTARNAELQAKSVRRAVPSAYPPGPRTKRPTVNLGGQPRVKRA